MTCTTQEFHSRHLPPRTARPCAESGPRAPTADHCRREAGRPACAHRRAGTWAVDRPRTGSSPPWKGLAPHAATCRARKHEANGPVAEGRVVWDTRRPEQVHPRDGQQLWGLGAGCGGDCSWGRGPLLGGRNGSGTGQRRRLHNRVGVLRATDTRVDTVSTYGAFTVRPAGVPAAARSSPRLFRPIQSP